MKKFQLVHEQTVFASPLFAVGKLTRLSFMEVIILVLVPNTRTIKGIYSKSGH